MQRNWMKSTKMKGIMNYTRLIAILRPKFLNWSNTF